MNIAGMHKLSLIDYPGKLAVVVFTQGCNFRCGFCHNPELVRVDDRLNTSLRQYGGQASSLKPVARERQVKGGLNFFDFLENRKGFLDGVCITGGEPLLQEDIEEFIRSIKERGFCVKLDTNGFLADRLERVINKNLVDYIALDIKGWFYGYGRSGECGENVKVASLGQSLNADNSRTCLRRQVVAPINAEQRGNMYSRIAGINVDIEKIKKSIKLIMESGLDYEFRTTVVADLHKKEDILNIARHIQGAKKYALQKFEIRDKILDDRFLNARSITAAEAKDWQRACSDFVEECELRGWN